MEVRHLAVGLLLILPWATSYSRGHAGAERMQVDTGDATGQQPRVLKTGTTVIGFVAYSPDGSELAVNFRFGEPVIFDTTTWQKRQGLPGLRMIAYSPDSSMMATAEGIDGLRIWKKGSRIDPRILAPPGPAIRWAAFSPDGRTLASAHDDNLAKVWDVITGQEKRILRGHAGPVLCATFSNDGRALFTASADKSVKQWDTTTWAEIRTLTGPDSQILRLASAPRGNALAALSKSGVVMIWDTVTWTATMKTGYAALAFSPDGATLALGGKGNQVGLFDVLAKRDLSPIALAEMVAKDAYPADVAVGLEDSDLRRLVPIFTEAMAFSPDGKTLAVGCWDGTIRFLDAVTK